jgi:UDP-glucose 4-epimerase
MHILVTGGAGFIGSNLIKLLSKNSKNTITCLDNYFTGNSERTAGVEYIRGSTEDIFNFSLKRPDIVYHLGEYSRIATSFEDIEKVWEMNCFGTFKTLQYCRENKCKLVYAGSSSRFGNNGKDEDLSPYSWIKSKNIELIKNYGKWFDLNYAIAYFYNVYGPGQIEEGRYATVIGIFLKKYLNNEPIPVVKPGLQKRYFTHVGDVVSGLEKIGRLGSDDGYCLCDENSLYSIRELAEMFSDNITYIDEQQGNRMNPVLPSRRCQQELGWQTFEILEEYINKIKGEKYVKTI